MEYNFILLLETPTFLLDTPLRTTTLNYSKQVLFDTPNDLYLMHFIELKILRGNET